MIYPLFRNVARRESLAEAALISQRMTEKRFREQALSVIGTIVAIENEVRQLKNGEKLTFEYPRVRFTTMNGESVEFRSPHGYTPCRSRVGESVTVLYQISNPMDARVEISPLS